jgi:hypothetical protein
MPVPDHIVRRRTGILLAYGTIALVYLYAVYYAAGLLDPIYEREVADDGEPLRRVIVYENRRTPQWADGPESQVASIVPPDDWLLNLENFVVPEDLRAQFEQALDNGNTGELLRPFIGQEANWQEERDAFIKAREFLRETFANFEVEVDYFRRTYYFADYVEHDLRFIRDPATENGRRLQAARRFYLNDSAWAGWRDDPDRDTKAPLPTLMYMLPDSIQQRRDGKVWRAAYAYFFTENVNGQVVEPLRELLERWTDLKDSIVQRVKDGDDDALGDLPFNYY